MIRVPQISREEAVELFESLTGSVDGVALLAIRGYYLNSMGARGRNDRRVYDDAICILTESEIFRYQANVDPSVNRYRVATLVPGVYDVVKHRHKGRYASFQIVEDVVRRDGISELDRGRHGINIHYDSEGLPTGSLGCLTLRKSQYWAFQKRLYALMDKHAKPSIKLLLIENVSKRTNSHKFERVNR